MSTPQPFRVVLSSIWVVVNRDFSSPKSPHAMQPGLSGCCPVAVFQEKSLFFVGGYGVRPESEKSSGDPLQLPLFPGRCAASKTGRFFTIYVTKYSAFGAVQLPLISSDFPMIQMTYRRFVPALGVAAVELSVVPSYSFRPGLNRSNSG